MIEIQSLLIELDQLKSVYRRAYISDGSRNESSAEHSWHLAIALLALKEIIPKELNLDHAIQMALFHDVCEIGAGDISVYDSNRSKKATDEDAYMKSLAAKYGGFGQVAQSFWHEYENQQSLESKWVKVVDRLLPFLLNLATQGRTWKEESICRSQVIDLLNKDIGNVSPRLLEWMKGEIDFAVQNGWLIDA